MNALDLVHVRLLNARFRLNDATRIVKTCVIGGERIKAEASNPVEFHRLHRYVTREPDTVKWIAEQLKPGDVFYDIGANVGLYSIFAARKCREQVQVYSFEPESQNYASLNRNVYRNGLSRCITTLCMAVTDRTCIDLFYVQGQLRAGGAIHQFGSTLDDKGRQFSPVHRQGMVGMSLDDLCYTYGLALPTQIKIDVDGQEGAVIRGACKVLRAPSLRSVLVEVTEAPGRQEHAQEISAALGEAGFTLLKKASINPMSDTSSSYNYIFVRPGMKG